MRVFFPTKVLSVIWITLACGCSHKAVGQVKSPWVGQAANGSETSVTSVPAVKDSSSGAVDYKNAKPMPIPAITDQEKPTPKELSPTPKEHTAGQTGSGHTKSTIVIPGITTP